MAFLSLGLCRDEDDSTPTPLRVVDKPAVQKEDRDSADVHSNAAASAKDKHQHRAESEVEAEKARNNSAHANHQQSNGNNGNIFAAAQAGAEPEQESEKDSWSETGLQIIQSVLRQAQNKASAEPPDLSSQQTSVGAGFHSFDPPSAGFPSIEELQEQIAGNIRAQFAAASSVVSRDPEPLPQHRAEKDRAETSAEIKASPAVEADSLSPLMQQIQAKIAADESSFAAPEPSAISPITPIAPAPTWMSKPVLRSEKRVSTVPSDFLSPVMEEIRRKLAAGDSTFTISDRERPDVLPRPAVSEPDNDDAIASVTPQNDFVPKTKVDGTPSFATFKFGYLPRRGLLYSLIGHEVAMFAIFLLVTYGFPSFREERLIVGSIHSQDHVIYLPEIGGGEQGQKSPGGGESKPQQASAAPARASKGFAYPGAQPILSNPPNPTNSFQTVLHPLKVHPEPLRKLVPLPNIVQMAETRLPSDLIAPKIAMPHHQASATPIKVRQDDRLRRNAKWNVPVKAPRLLAKADMPKLAAAEQPLPPAPKVAPKKPEDSHETEKPTRAPIKVSAEKKTENDDKQIAPPSTAQVARLEMHGKSAEPLLSLSPAPLPTNAKVPSGEARGRFAIAPGGKLNPNSVTPGKPNGAPSESPATGQEKSTAANATSELASNTGAGIGHNPAAGGGSGKSAVAAGGGSSGEGSGAGKTSGPRVGGAGTGNGRGSAGNGAGVSGHGAGTGSGAGSGSGTGAFPGITIQGGEGNESGSDSHTFAMAPQTPYQMTIVATASSGGGLADYGVFENQRVYTVYVPMQRTPQEADPTWTLQYALENESAASGNDQLVAPTPVMREWPQIPAQLEKDYAQQQVVVYAVLGVDGKLTHISIKQSPDDQVSVPITRALAKWVFRPAQIDNKPVPVKILLGIPL